MKLVPRSSDGSVAMKCKGLKPCSMMHTNSKLFQPGVKILVQRAPLLSGLHVVQNKKFQRPLLKRRAYGKDADLALKHSSLGQKRRFDGMAKLLARAGKGLNYKLPLMKNKSDQDGTESESGSDDEEDAKEPDAPFEPLCLWTSPHEGGEAKGLPSQMYVHASLDKFTRFIFQCNANFIHRFHLIGPR
jgi:hypothetical protein